MVTYDVDQTHTQDIYAFDSADGKMVCHSSSAIVTNEYDLQIADIFTALRILYFRFQCFEHDSADTQLVVFLNGSTCTVARQVWHEEWCIFW